MEPNLVPIDGVWGYVAMSLKATGIFTIVLVVVAYTTLAERRVSAWIQDRHGPNRVGPFGLLQPIADGIKNIIKEETLPETASKFFFVLAPILSVIIVAGYGFFVWIYQIITGPPSV